MSLRRRFGWAVVVASTILAPVARAEDGGGLVGWVESTQGAPVAGALVSVFGKGIRGGSLITLADGQGQFVLSALPAGSYTLRAIGTGHLPSPAQHITVLPNRDALYREPHSGGRKADGRGDGRTAVGGSGSGRRRSA